MTVERPEPGVLEAVSARYALGSSERDIGEFAPLIDGLLGSWDEIERGEGPLSGRTVAVVKDNTTVAGVPMMNGSAMPVAEWRRSSPICPKGGPADQSFDQPWQIRAFALAIAAYHNRQYEWSPLQLALIESIRRWESDGAAPERHPRSYYEHWLTALEGVLTVSGSLADESVDERTRTVLATRPDRHDQHVHPEPSPWTPRSCSVRGDTGVGVRAGVSRIRASWGSGQLHRSERESRPLAPTRSAQGAPLTQPGSSSTSAIHPERALVIGVGRER